MRWLLLIAAASVMSASASAAEGQPYGCWSIRDDVERLACFDMALGPPPAEPPSHEGNPSDGDRGTPAASAAPRPESVLR